MLYEILSGKKAFSAQTFAELRQEKEQSTPTAPSELRAGIEPALERLVMRCLDRARAPVYGFRTSLGGRPVFAGGNLDG